MGIDDVQLLAQALFLLGAVFWSILRIIAYIPYAIATISLRAVVPWAFCPPSGAVFFKGSVFHTRRRPKENSFTYPVRMAFINLDHPPTWWDSISNDTMTADEARAVTGSNGPVWLLTHPPSAGYVQNPISVYYCYCSSGDGNGAAKKNSDTINAIKSDDTIVSWPEHGLEKCIAEVTNTPWGDRVIFVFYPTTDEGEEGEVVPKALHVSPLMDMNNMWKIKTRNPGNALFLSVAATHPEHGDYFLAALSLRRDTSVPSLPNEVASFKSLLKYGFQPQRVAFWIYWQAVLLLWKGVPFHSPPGQAACCAAEGRSAHPQTQAGRFFEWRPASKWPWKSSSSGEIE